MRADFVAHTTCSRQLTSPLCSAGSYHHISNLSNPGGPLRRYVIAGNICESGDVFTLSDGEDERCAFPVSEASCEPDLTSALSTSAAAGTDHDHHRPGTRLLPELRLGDMLALHCAGAYGFTMSSEYNLRPRPAEVVVLLCRRRQGISSGDADELAREHAPSLTGLRWHLVDSANSHHAEGGTSSSRLQKEATVDAGTVAVWAVSRAALTVEQLVEQHLSGPV